MRELSYEEMRLVAGGCENCETVDFRSEEYNPANDKCSWGNFWSSAAKGAVMGMLGGAAYGSAAAGVGIGLGAASGAVVGAWEGMAHHLGTCWWK